MRRTNLGEAERGDAGGVAADGLVAESPRMRRLLADVARIAPRDVTVLLRGETGTGKERVASLLHARSRRAAGPLVRCNCAAIAAELADAELFGAVRGAFTGAVESRRGFFSAADGGTLVLDEIGELPRALQPKLLRALQEGELQPVGAGRVERVDVRVVACTNRDLEAEVRAGRFREDLYYRLAVVELVVPPLRDRREDLPRLAVDLARELGQRFGVERVRLSPALLGRLQQADWPGNVRQLENAIARMIALCPGPVLGPEAIAVVFPTASGAARDTAPVARSAPPLEELPLRAQLDGLERRVIAAMLAATGGNQSAAARRLGLARTVLIDRLKKYGLL
ncbi:sigma54 specific transcriptional regulator, Fis family [Anaeromyxobacter dehalogenans 2CP-1]|uniref:Sigma54 specific transcriptional regulator, Fis family n=1 Tax=Anaeromyxobacter dehalogenans (strain ATCC BAA-258 / DSM 21875 / 2CP-1) TaxID=455488 RepID=B8JC76_ANAD2|nr:sigma-54 dependent transcriptional regulator [Anaeromyxobacter dehalogenans]ACL65816.1 sigma54 specific transcriptional regulator, Fis family [Anaeromyxobacter dehalogenans 2CP-1]